MPGLIGKKVGMTSIYGASGKNIPCTVLEVGPCVVTQVRTLEKDGYSAVQLGFGERSEKNTSKAMLGHFKKAGVDPMRHLVEFKKFLTMLSSGDTLKVEDVFNEGEYVSVIGTSKGKGFQGVVKRHGFAGVGQATHGQHNVFVHQVLSVQHLTQLVYSRECVWLVRWVTAELLSRT